jgi:predicted transcriptional regulator
MSLRLRREVREPLEREAHAAGRSKTSIIEEALSARYGRAA